MLRSRVWSDQRRARRQGWIRPTRRDIFHIT